MEGKISISSSSFSETDSDSDGLGFGIFSSSSSSFISSSLISDDEFDCVWSDSNASVSCEKTTFGETSDTPQNFSNILEVYQNEALETSTNTNKKQVHANEGGKYVILETNVMKNDIANFSIFINKNEQINEAESFNTTQNTLGCTIFSEDNSEANIKNNAPVLPEQCNKLFCDICGELFRSQATLDVHKLNHLVSESYACEICEHESKNREDYILHISTHDRNVLNLTGSLNKKQIHPNSRPYQCDTCGKAFRFHSGFKRHMAAHISSHTCNICNASFPSLLLCHQHKLKHARKRIHACDVCKKTFQRPYQLSVHKQAHETDKKYECVECGTNYCYKTSLMRHTLKYHSPNSPKFQCDICGELFKSKKMLNCHVILHTAKKLIQCSDCNLTFKYRSSYHRHRVIHKSQKPYRCNHCGKLFKKENDLKVHKSLHFANEEAYVCKLCDKTFAYESFLNKHMTSHNTACENITISSEN